MSVHETMLVNPVNLTAGAQNPIVCVGVRFICGQRFIELYSYFARRAALGFSSFYRGQFGMKSRTQRAYWQSMLPYSSVSPCYLSQPSVFGIQAVGLSPL